MFVVTRPSLPKSATLNVFRENLQKTIEDLYLFTKKSLICIFCFI